MSLKHIGCFAVSIFLVVVAADVVWAGETTAKEPFVVFLVRHAEKVDDSDDPELSIVGKNRAKKLAEVLCDAKIDSIHSTDYVRTRGTAAPLAAKNGLKVELYEAKTLISLIAKIHERAGRHLVVGHSNTTPMVVKLLGGDPGSEIDVDGEYDRLYIVTQGSNGLVSTVLIRY